MTWTAPPVTRADEPFTGPERPNLDGFLDWYRGTLLSKCAGLTGEQLAERAVPPSSLSLLGLVRHMTDVERAWFRIRFRGEDLPFRYGTHAAGFDETDPARAAEDFAAYEAEIELVRAAVADASLDDECAVPPGDGRGRSLRWIFTHMIEEYARHCGHADLLRERVDGVTGD
ncbi:MAG: DinB family protein [Streptosporangiales bacterium]|jgi:uncharacterized damage-inducible protein DinB|nr:DinB family protein [Streptosporangiales bacterium]